MSNVQRFAIGGLGGLLPIIVSLLSYDLTSVIDHIDLLNPGVYVGSLLKVIIWFGLGGILAVFTDASTKPVTLLWTGIAAPALITSYINGSYVPGPIGQTSHSAAVSSAYAAEASSQIPIVRVDFVGDVVKGITTPLPKIQREQQQLREQQQQQQQQQQHEQQSQPPQTPHGSPAPR